MGRLNSNTGEGADKPKVFEPVEGKPMLEKYPELEDIPQFRDIGGDKYLRFVWYMGCKSSPFYLMDDIEYKVSLCLAKANLELSDADRANWLNGEFPDRIKDAITYMGTFLVDARAHAYELVQIVLANAGHIINKDKTEIDLMPWDDKKKYMDIATDYMKQLPSIINQLETKFGLNVRSTNKVKGGREKTHADEVLHNS